MRKLFVSVLLSVFPLISSAQTWMVKKTMDDFGDPTGEKIISQVVKAEGGIYKVTISHKLGTTSDFSIVVTDMKGVPARLGIPVTKELLFRYKIGDKENTVTIPNLGASSAQGKFQITYSGFEQILLSTSLPIRCIIASEDRSGMHNYIRFTVSPSNYRQLSQQ